MPADDSQNQPSDAPPLLGYASPTPLARAGDLFRDGPLLIARDGIELPDRCILCGQTAPTRPLRLTFSWDSSFQRTRQKSTLELRRSGTVRVHLCPAHHRKWLL